jgi:hypothetical protein
MTNPTKGHSAAATPGKVGDRFPTPISLALSRPTITAVPAATG